MPSPAPTHTSLFRALCAVLLAFGIAVAPACNLGESGNTTQEQPGSTVQAALCVGISPPESMYLPLPVPEPDVSTVDAVQSDALTLISVSDSQQSADSGDALISGTIRDATQSAADSQNTGDGLETEDSPLEDILESVDATSEVLDDASGNQPPEDASAIVSMSDATDDTNEERATEDAMVSRSPDASTSSPDGGGAVLLPPIDFCAISPGTCIDQPAPEWSLFDFQPQSCGYQATYGLKEFVGNVTVVVLLAAW